LNFQIGCVRNISCNLNVQFSSIIILSRQMLLVSFKIATQNGLKAKPKKHETLWQSLGTSFAFFAFCHKWISATNKKERKNLFWDKNCEYLFRSENCPSSFVFVRNSINLVFSLKKTEKAKFVLKNRGKEAFL